MICMILASIIMNSISAVIIIIASVSASTDTICRLPRLPLHCKEGHLTNITMSPIDVSGDSSYHHVYIIIIIIISIISITSVIIIVISSGDC